MSAPRAALLGLALVLGGCQAAPALPRGSSASVGSPSATPSAPTSMASGGSAQPGGQATPGAETPDPATPDPATTARLRALATAAAGAPDQTARLRAGGYLHVSATTHLTELTITASPTAPTLLRTKDVWLDWSGTGYQQYRTPGEVSLTQRVSVPEPSLAHLTPRFCAELPGEPEALRARLVEVSDGTTEDSSVLAAALFGLLSSQQLDPARQAAVYELLATLPEVTVAARELEGRPVVLVAAPEASGQTRSGLFVDPRSGRVIGQEAWTRATVHTTTVTTGLVDEVPQSVVEVAET